MARTAKTGLDYFPLDVDMDEKIELVEARHGIVGFGIIIKLYQAIYKNGYYVSVDEERLLLFSKRINVDINRVIDVIEDAARWGIFSAEIHKKHKILTSCGIQKRYISATTRRNEIEFYEHLLLVRDVRTRCKPGINVNIKAINGDIIHDYGKHDVNINPINTDTGTQSKVKESKEKKRTNARARTRAATKKNATPPPTDFKITDNMRKYAASKNFRGDLDAMTERFLNWHSAKGNKFADWSAAWRNWLLKDIELNAGKLAPPTDRNGGRTLDEVLS